LILLPTLVSDRSRSLLMVSRLFQAWVIWIHKERAKKEGKLDSVLKLFPIFRERQRQKAGSLSGGEQQMLAIARGLMADPAMLMLDEPSFGLAPRIVLEFFDVIKEIRKEGLSVLLVEQDIIQSLSIADRGYVLGNGEITIENSAEALANDDHVKKAYIGI
jgi:branched-chain amino acid transport system ATP-binding protein